MANGVPNFMCVNKSGRQIPLYDGYSKRIGTLYPDECFVRTPVAEESDWDNFLIVCRNSSGKVINACIKPEKDNIEGILTSIRTPVSQLSKGQITAGSSVFKTYMLRKSERVYNPDGYYSGLTLPAGTMLAASNSDCGNSHPEWKLIHWYKNSSGWHRFTSPDYRFINIGLDKASMLSTVSLYPSTTSAV